MKVLVDTPVWSLALRRRKEPRGPLIESLRELILENRAVLIGPVRQEILSGLSHRGQFDRLREKLVAFPDEAILRRDYEQAAAFSNRCRRKGVQGSGTDFLICSVAVRKKMAIFTSDRDFEHFQQYLPIRIFRGDDG